MFKKEKKGHIIKILEMPEEIIENAHEAFGMKQVLDSMFDEVMTRTVEANTRVRKVWESINEELEKQGMKNIEQRIEANEEVSYDHSKGAFIVRERISRRDN